MKKRLFVLSIVLAGIILLIPSCKDEENGFHQVSQIEREIYLKINSFRSSEGLSTLVEQFLMFKEGRVISEKLAAGEYSLDSQLPQNDIDELTTNLGGDANAILTLTSNIEDAESIVNSLIENPSTVEILKGEFSQCGVGFSTGTDQLHYVAIMLINIPN
jgi:hypothetical protein